MGREKEAHIEISVRRSPWSASRSLSFCLDEGRESESVFEGELSINVSGLVGRLEGGEGEERRHDDV